MNRRQRAAARIEVSKVGVYGMRRMPSLTVLILSASFVCCSGREADFPEVDGWTRAGEVQVYDAENLWEYIDGAAELFVEYDVQTCMTGDLASGSLVVTVDLYDMGTPLNAFGIFARERSQKGVPLPEATEAVVSPPYQALLLKGSTYVKVNAVQGALTATSGRAFLESIARTLPGRPGYPPELELLPQNGKVAGTEGYQREGFLGLAELNDCLYAEYAGDGDRTWQGFVALPPTGSAAAYRWNALAGEWDALEHRGHTVLYREIPYRGLVGVVNTQQAVVGVADAADRAELLNRLDGFIP
ncbi:MAG: hypothetical protein GTN62_10415 [Gemmatimonadales bacterium]|nr:hypothetical protein [Gemmatimonadales bacterium]NIN11973.1 hypothetical protein [Gemmatimonadales bacterium]NIN50508.1 hypothetical protein [Gemmatimonadales bacterium]NIP07972.1 hypothetical protein [Gemmatimonadales bacterium]NIR01994.1 hypothetical protein [Gemmatimonadales bacterium]